MMKWIHLSLLLIYSAVAFAQKPAHLVRPSDTLDPDPFVNTVQQSLNLFYADYANTQKYDSIISALNYTPGQIPTFSDSIICERLEKMNDLTPFHLDCNAATLSTIKFFAAQRRGFIRVALGRSALYFDLFEEKLTEYGLPLELRYLSVIESGLRPQVKSRAGALGLWQFMYKTGLYFGLDENSYIDERMDPEKATDAACRYLKQLYGIYGDWNLALAAYNAGPGNVNHAIRKSGGKTTYWEVRPFLPKETQGYVPNFIAAAYMMTYHAEYNIIPMEAKIHNAQLDTMCLKNGVHMQTISKLTDWELTEIQSLNPVYKTTYIPKMKPARCVTGPLEKIGLLVSFEDSLYVLEEAIYNPKPVVVPPPTTPQDSTSQDSTIVISSIPDTLSNTTPGTNNLLYHKVKTGENLRQIALRYNVSIEQLMEWNGLRTTNIYVGQKLSIYSSQSAPPPSPTPTPTPAPPAKKYYTVRAGDTFGRIAQRNNLTQSQLQRLNPGVKVNSISVGQRIRIK
ncbi:MAG: LysM peptidoglycan-binding domain-containing protein [Flavobacteriales bacterium]